jgi:hypothetical protein
VAYGLFALATGIDRWDAAYFTPQELERYALPGQVVIDAERGIRTGDHALMAVLQGLRHPAEFETNPDLELVFAYELTVGYRSYNYLDTPFGLWRSLQNEADFVTYVYSDTETFERSTLHIEKVNGRWVLTPPDARFYFLSGYWLRVFTPVSITYWLVLVIALTMVWLYRASRVAGDDLFGRLPPGT